MQQVLIHIWIQPLLLSSHMWLKIQLFLNSTCSFHCLTKKFYTHEINFYQICICTVMKTMHRINYLRGNRLCFWGKTEKKMMGEIASKHTKFCFMCICFKRKLAKAEDKSMEKEKQRNRGWESPRNEEPKRSWWIQLCLNCRVRKNHTWNCVASKNI